MDGLKGLPGWFREAGTPKGLPPGDVDRGGRRRHVGKGPRGQSFIDRNIAAVTAYTRELLSGEMYACKTGLLQGIDIRARILGIMALVAACAVTSSAFFLAGMLTTAVLLGMLSSIGPGKLAKKILPAFVFTLLLTVPVYFGVITPGTTVGGWDLLGHRVEITAEGLKTGIFFLLRVTTMVSLVMLLFLATRQADLFKGLARLPLPGFFVMALFMTFRYVFILLKIAEDTQLARKSRTIGGAGSGEQRRWLTSRLAYLLRRSLITAEDVAIAMAARGFTGRVMTFPPGNLAVGDFFWIGFSAFIFLLSFGL